MLNLDLAQFAEAANWHRLPRVVAAENFGATATSPTFPGALLPAVAADGRVLWYAAAGDAATWRRLRPLLVAYAGPTVTCFAGEPIPLRPERGPDRVLLEAGAFAVGLLLPPHDGLDFAVRALCRLREALERKPADLRPPPVSTAAIIAHFDMCLAASDRAGAETLLAILRSEWRIDALNLRFAEVRLLAAFRDWSALVARDWVPALCQVRKPLPVAYALMEALWHVHLAPFTSDAAEIERRYRSSVRSLMLPLLAEVPPDAGDTAANVHRLETPAVVQVAAPFAGAPDDWLAWLSSIELTDYHGAVEAARDIATRRPADNLQDLDAIRALADGLHRVSDGTAQDRLIAALPTLVQWVKEDSNYPRRTLRPLYDALLTLFALLDARGAAEREAAADLFDALLEIGLTVSDYRRILQDIAAMIDEGAGSGTIYWLIEVADVALRHPTRDDSARLGLLNTILVSMQTMRSLLSGGQRVAYMRIATSASWPPLPEEAAVPSVDHASWLAGKTVAIYTLTEAAARQARDALLALAPATRIELVHDHVCTSRLESLARQADLFVLAAASAKHAATDCIHRHRENAPLVYAAGRGFTSLVRAVEEYMERTVA